MNPTDRGTIFARNNILIVTKPIKGHKCGLIPYEPPHDISNNVACGYAQSDQSLC